MPVTLPVSSPEKDVEPTEVKPAIVVEEAPSAIDVDPTVIELLVKEIVGVACSPELLEMVMSFPATRD